MFKSIDCYYAPDQAQADRRYHVAIIERDEPGYWLLDGKFSFRTHEIAERYAREQNAALGLSDADSTLLVLSSLLAQKLLERTSTFA
jgi:hypothetical protein